MDRPESWRKIVAEMRDEDTGTRFVSGDGMIASLHAAQAELRKLADRVKAACEALEVSRDSVDAFAYSTIGARDDAVGKLRDVVVRAMGTCTTCKRTDCDSCINMNSYWIPDARAALAAAKGETVTNRSGMGDAAKMREALEWATSTIDVSPEVLDETEDWENEVVCWVLELQKKAHAALAAPPRNCDRPECSTPKGAAQEWAKHCSAFADKDEECAGCLHQHQEHEAPCVVEWLLAPAAREGGK